MSKETGAVQIRLSRRVIFGHRKSEDASECIGQMPVSKETPLWKIASSAPSGEDYFSIHQEIEGEITSGKNSSSFFARVQTSPGIYWINAQVVSAPKGIDRVILNADTTVKGRLSKAEQSMKETLAKTPRAKIVITRNGDWRLLGKKDAVITTRY